MNGIASRLAEPEERTSTASSAGQGSNSAVLRGYNERVILAALRRLGEASKAEPARHAGLTQNATGQIVRELERQWIEDCAGALLNPVLSIACLLDVQSIVIGGDLPGPWSSAWRRSCVICWPARCGKRVRHPQPLSARSGGTPPPWAPPSYRCT